MRGCRRSSALQPGAPSWPGTRPSTEKEEEFVAAQEPTLHTAPCSGVEFKFDPDLQVILKA